MTYFFVRSGASRATTDQAVQIQLVQSNWDDYGFGTTFTLYYVVRGVPKEIGITKIAHLSMTSVGWAAVTRFTRLPEQFDKLDDQFVSVGQDSSFYTNLVAASGGVSRAREALEALRDLTVLSSEIDKLVEHEVVYTSLLRTLTVGTITNQYRSILRSGDIERGYKLTYVMDPADSESPRMTFAVDPHGVVPSNVHVLIGSNGTGKTTALTRMRYALDPSFKDLPINGASLPWSSHIVNDDPSHIVGILSLSSSAFEPFVATTRDERLQAKFRVNTVNFARIPAGDLTPRVEGVDRQKDDASESPGKRLRSWYQSHLLPCLDSRGDRLLSAMRILAESDPILGAKRVTEARSLRNLDLASLSSGHKIAILTVVALVHQCEAKTLVLMDEPESHLHPPLLAGLTRAVSSIMSATNSLAVVATHSPVVLQEVPRRCAWKMWATGSKHGVARPSIETFGENLGVLTREVFQVELDKSGFYTVLMELAGKYPSYESAIDHVGRDLSEEARLILRMQFRRNGR